MFHVPVVLMQVAKVIGEEDVKRFSRELEAEMRPRGAASAASPAGESWW